MQNYYFHIVILTISSITNILIQIVSFRVFSKSGLGLLKSEYLGFAAGSLSLFFLEFYNFIQTPSITMDMRGIFIVDLLIYFSISYNYFHFLNLGETGRRIRILRELYEAKGGLYFEELIRRYAAKEIIERRINRLISNRQIIYRDGRYYLGGSAMLIMAKIFVFLKILLLGKSSEFD